MDEFRIRFEPTPKQAIAWRYLHDHDTTEILFGGGGGGGKTTLGCVWLVKNCLQYPGSRWMLARAVLKTLKATTLLTLFDVLCERRDANDHGPHFGLKANQHYHYNSIDAAIRFWNGSTIYLKDLFEYPSDPEFDQLGSSEFCGAFIDEGSQIGEKAKNIVLSRLRYKLDEFGIIAKLFMGSNPTKTFLYREFYQPWKEGKLTPDRAFVQALAKDNKFLSKNYTDNLDRLDAKTRARIRDGDWEYDDDPSKLVEYNKILDLFTNRPQRDGKKYLTCDAARFGGDQIVIDLWDGWHNEFTTAKKKQGTDQTALDLLAIASQQNVPRSNILIDEDGVGGGVLDQIKGANGFQNGSKAIEIKGVKQFYRNLKTQCYCITADRINKGTASVNPEIAPEYKNNLVQDLEQVKQKNADKDGLIELVDKDVIKRNIGRSPDFGDAFMMRAWFDLKKRGVSVYGFNTPDNPEHGPDAQLANFLRGA